MRILVAMILVAVVVMYATPLFAADVAAGKDSYTKKCASCHGAAGEGKDTVAKLFKVELKPLSSKEVQSMSDADIKKTILEGTGKMKGIKDVDAKAADDIVAYVRTLAKK
jgi:mono/diheme cytochrome c family protein